MSASGFMLRSAYRSMGGGGGGGGGGGVGGGGGAGLWSWGGLTDP